ncbi:enoyl-CoA hydratase/isomerase family protein [Mycolicibacterium smegmatis]|uniref:enoyl-CoA hydratase/isomerase family protein n=1 Tax=Mycolicibacterium smegmatis TaxID=1772 RepID=UPI0005D862BF|nr:enoyl-CoA hydratase/isomerase family protein [Mycolicibacterium smegmatis]MDF1897846.1 enoyl-CoA hydratase/isomerase family protein [Mycolicibacterium smegmatis]MDF1904402.1 enoyl-CoA hydratase/isomerase family protein [Mycolicibacterium smegmatis]MDF1917623.1 enoyl-CoA hydratase/isomerase family protein [Mycolicibacterium smegmatis]MDF1922980.1 enoyl-CoA hydratase/isomerase family protein [Mycolicibacterium smegmatis]UGT73023.1 enoyl-CoA hydratase/isomerase family protein [Mycolicibacteriu
MPDRQYTRFRLVRNRAVLRVVFDHPPMNLFDQTMISECSALLDDLRADRSVRVVLFSSAGPDFFLGHADLSLFLAPREGVPPKPVRLTLLQDLFERLRTVPQATIAVVEGRATGAGVELVTSCDMAFAARGRAVLTLFETAVGVLPGATGTQRLPRLMGRQRSPEIVRIPRHRAHPGHHLDRSSTRQHLGGLSIRPPHRCRGRRTHRGRGRTGRNPGHHARPDARRVHPRDRCVSG